MAGSICEEKKFATYQVSMSREETDCKLTVSWSVSLSPLFWLKNSIELLELKWLCEEKLRKKKISGRAVGFYRAGMVHSGHIAAPETTFTKLLEHIHSRRKNRCSKGYHEENHCFKKKICVL